VKALVVAKTPPEYRPIVKLYVPVAVGVPVTNPEDVPRLRPVGRAPAVIPNVTVPLAETLPEYPLDKIPSGINVAVITTLSVVTLLRVAFSPTIAEAEV
jgi:hypothetical protein